MKVGDIVRVNIPFYDRDGTIQYYTTDVSILDLSSPGRVSFGSLYGGGMLT
jgi:hypothetical protein